MGKRPDEHALRAAVGRVHDPEIHRPLAELGMLGDVRARSAGRVEIGVALTTQSCPLADRIRDEVVVAARTVPDVREVSVEFDVMPEHQRMELARRLRAEAGSGGDSLAQSAPAPRIYAVASGKGGVGKSTVTANLAAALAAEGNRVGVLDADVWGYSIPRLFGVRRNPVALKGLMFPIESYGVALMSVGFLVGDDEPVIWRGPMLHKALQQFIEDVYWGELDILLLDLPPGTGDVPMSLCELLPSAALLAVTTPQPVARGVASRMGRMAHGAGMPVAGIVENMSELVCGECGTHTPLFGSGGGSALAEELAAPLLGSVPLDRELRESGDAGVPAVIAAPNAPSAVELRRIAGVLPETRRSLAGRSLPLTVV